MSWLSDLVGTTAINQNFDLDSTEQFGDYYDLMLNTGDVAGQQLIRKNMMDSAPSLDSLLGVQQASGGSGAIAAMQAARGQRQAGEMAANAILQSRGQDLGRAMQALQGKQAGEQYTSGMEYQQASDNRDQVASFADSLIGLGGTALTAGWKPSLKPNKHIRKAAGATAGWLGNAGVAAGDWLGNAGVAAQNWLGGAGDWLGGAAGTAQNWLQGGYQGLLGRLPWGNTGNNSYYGENPGGMGY